MARVLRGVFGFRKRDDIGWNGVAGVSDGLKKLLLCDRLQYRNAAFQLTELSEKTTIASGCQHPSDNNQQARTGEKQNQYERRMILGTQEGACGQEGQAGP